MDRIPDPAASRKGRRHRDEAAPSEIGETETAAVVARVFKEAPGKIADASSKDKDRLGLGELVAPDVTDTQLLRTLFLGKVAELAPQVLDDLLELLPLYRQVGQQRALAFLQDVKQERPGKDEEGGRLGKALDEWAGKYSLEAVKGRWVLEAAVWALDLRVQRITPLPPVTLQTLALYDTIPKWAREGYWWLPGRAEDALPPSEIPAPLPGLAPYRPDAEFRREYLDGVAGALGNGLDAVHRAAERAHLLPVGSPLLADTLALRHVGPLLARDAVKLVDGWVEEAETYCRQVEEVYIGAGWKRSAPREALDDHLTWAVRAQVLGERFTDIAKDVPATRPSVSGAVHHILADIGLEPRPGQRAPGRPRGKRDSSQRHRVP